MVGSTIYSAMCYRVISFSFFSAMVHFVALSQSQLAPIGIATTPFGSGWVEDMTFDPTNGTLYLANYLRHTVVALSEVSTAPVTPISAAPWVYTVVAGKDGINGPPGPTETTSTTASLTRPSGLVGWPQYAVGPHARSDGASASWVGLWIVDQGNNALRFLHFHRRNNLTLTAGSTSGVSGLTDGIGTAVRLQTPLNIAWGRFLRSVVVGPTSAPAWTSVVFWSEYYSHCVRQGIPQHNDAAHSPLEDVSSTADASIVLRDMVLNVSSFVGMCGSGNFRSRVGRVVPWSPMFKYPFGVALVGLPTAAGTATSVLFLGDSNNNRLVMISPMYPEITRYLTVVYSNSGFFIDGVAIGRVLAQLATSVVMVELMVGTDFRQKYLNISVALWVNTVSNGTTTTTTVAVTQGVGNVTMSVLSAAGVGSAKNVALVRYSPNSTLVVFSGDDNNNPTVYHALEFFCCLGSDYSAPLLLQDGGDGVTTTTTGTMSAVGRRGSHTTTTSLSSVSDVGSGSFTTNRRPCTSSPSLSLTIRVPVPRRLVASEDGSFSSSPSSRLTKTKSTIIMLIGPGARNASWQPPSFVHPSLNRNQQTIAAAASLAGVFGSTMVSGASTRAAVPGRAVAVWRCGVEGPSQAAADDPQQFLSFGLSLGEDTGTGEATVRGALILTSSLRVGIVAVLFLVVKLHI